MTVTASPYSAALESAAWRQRSARGVIRLGGPDRITWLQGLLTNDLRPLAGGGACYAAWLTPHGRMITDADVIELGDAAWLDVPAPLASSIAGRLDSLIFAEDVRVEDASAAIVSFGVYGPEAARVASRALEAVVPQDAVAPYAVRQIEGGLGRAVVVGSDALGVPGVHVYVPAGAATTVVERLRGSFPELDETTATVLRVEAGRPEFLVDMGDDTIPLEAGLESRAISHTKGCYVGQEIIVRLRDRAQGRVARRLMGLLLEGDGVPAAGEPLLVDGRTVGRITSAVRSPAAGRPIALGYVHRDHTTPGTALRVGAAEDRAATVVELPFRR